MSKKKVADDCRSYAETESSARTRRYSDGRVDKEATVKHSTRDCPGDTGPDAKPNPKPSPEPTTKPVAYSDTYSDAYNDTYDDVGRYYAQNSWDASWDACCGEPLPVPESLPSYPVEEGIEFLA